jgi:hypothetical protein
MSLKQSLDQLAAVTTPAVSVVLSPEAQAGLAAGIYRWAIDPVKGPFLVAVAGA